MFPRVEKIGKKVQKVLDPKNGHAFAYWCPVHNNIDG